jgi:dihydrofolate synthase / folylpolyglutamate synthase
MHFSTLSEWLSWIDKVHINEIELGLERVRRVAERLSLLTPSCPVIIVGGTNGKGSTVSGLEAIYRAAGYQVGAFTTPVLWTYNEQVRLNGQVASDQAFCQAFEKIEKARGDIPLTFFEYGTLAALVLFEMHALDVWILEVGLGGRLDAVNIIDADVAVVTTISLDHVAWLGDTREAIGYEKAGIFRERKPAVCGDNEPPASISDYAKKIGTPLYCQERDFFYQEKTTTWSWTFNTLHYTDLPKSVLLTQNMSTVLMVITLLQPRLAVSREAINAGLSKVTLPGRLQIVEGEIMRVYDVSHNPASVAVLAKCLESIPCQGKTYAVFSMLGDKDITESIKLIKAHIDEWYVAPLPVKRGASLQTLKRAFEQAGVTDVHYFSTIQEADDVVKHKATPGDRIIAFGSFHTLASLLG